MPVFADDGNFLAKMLKVSVVGGQLQESTEGAGRGTGTLRCMYVLRSTTEAGGLGGLVGVLLAGWLNPIRNTAGLI